MCFQDFLLVFLRLFWPIRIMPLYVTSAILCLKFKFRLKQHKSYEYKFYSANVCVIFYVRDFVVSKKVLMLPHMVE